MIYIISLIVNEKSVSTDDEIVDFGDVNDKARKIQLCTRCM